jgi:hypothetical protein
MFVNGSGQNEQSLYDRRWTPSDGKSSLCLWQDELKKVKKKST